MLFKVDNEIKQDYLGNKTTSTAKSDVFVLRSADEYEDMIGKPIYNMDFLELKEMITMQFGNTSVNVVKKNISILGSYVDFCINQNVVNHGQNRFTAFTVQDMAGFVHKYALSQKYITKETMREYHNILYNEQDRLLIQLPYIGVRGRTIKGATFEEIINLQIDDLDEKNKLLTLTQNDGKHRIIDVDYFTMGLIQDTYERRVYVENNGQEITTRETRRIVVNNVGRYVLRTPGKKKMKKATSVLINVRMGRIQRYTDNPYLTVTTLYISGMLDRVFDIYKEKGEVTKNDYLEICLMYNYEKYWNNIMSLFERYRRDLNV